MTLSILGLGTAVPNTVVDQASAAGIASRVCCRTDEQRSWLPLMYEQSGIRTRHLVLGQEVVADVLLETCSSGSPFLPVSGAADAGPTTAVRLKEYQRHAGRLAAGASRRALDAAGVPPQRITHLVTVSCTGFHAPGIEFDLIRDLGLAPTVARTHVGFMGCHGALNGLRVARAFASDPHARILTCAVELCSLHYHYGWNPERMVANALFADGAAAVVGAASGPPGGWRLITQGTVIIPNSSDAMSWSIGDHGFAMTLSRAVPRLIREHLRPWLVDWLAGQNLAITDVAAWAVHPGGPRVLDAVAEALQLDGSALEVSRSVLADYGNMSSPTVLFVLERLMADRRPGPTVMLGFGPGMVAEAALVSPG